METSSSANPLLPLVFLLFLWHLLTAIVVSVSFSFSESFPSDSAGSSLIPDINSRHFWRTSTNCIVFGSILSHSRH
ncbi:hypothetical protein B484DRAFT_452042 [Ochromonadaceae sp. CCMP2298]|nr:hypothetical protein B484DRAFT_452042 [Ochromonadaceae sp. CCMP2298]